MDIEKAKEIIEFAASLSSREKQFLYEVLTEELEEKPKPKSSFNGILMAAPKTTHKTRRTVVRTERRFKHWKRGEDRHLNAISKKGWSVAEMAKELGRSKLAIRMRLAQLRKKRVHEVVHADNRKRIWDAPTEQKLLETLPRLMHQDKNGHGRLNRGALKELAKITGMSAKQVHYKCEALKYSAKREKAKRDKAAAQARQTALQDDDE